MKAYRALYDDSDYCILIHGENRGKAKVRFTKCDPSGEYDRSLWNDIRLYRVSGLDDKPITFENAKNAGFQYIDGDSYYDDEIKYIEPGEFTNFCDCPLCSKKAGDQ